MTIPRILAIAVACLVLGALAGVGRPDAAHGQQAGNTDNVISVTGLGGVTTVPDRAELSFGVVSQAPTARAALTANAADARRVIAAHRSARIHAPDIQTEQISLSPRNADNGEAIIGYTASNTVSARIRDLDRAGAVIDAAVAAGANTVFGPSLSRADQTELYRTALRAAVAEARSKAQALAAAGGVSLGRVVSVVEGGGVLPVASAERGAGDVATPIEPRTQRIEAMVTVTFAIQ